MSIHISARQGEIAKIVLMPGDPLRAKHIVDLLLPDATLVSSTRNIFMYTGTYKGVPVTIGASGMGCPSIGIYSYELYTEYGVECIIRIGTAGAYTNNLKVYDVINVDNAFSESTFAKCAFNMDGDFIPHQGVAFEIINKVAASISQPLIAANIHSSDVFYRSNPAVPAIAAANNCVAVEMEAFALFANAKYLNKMAATIITVSDIIPTHEGMTPEQRETSLRKMYELALESTIAIHNSLEKK